ncbi:MAG: GNAT family N-acetyltransferase [Rikenellaceae bacterium]|nr:GNAT family N-acetyltransferase [Rikenellaceae bacterium]
MKEMIDPVDREVLKQELNEDRYVRDTNNGGNIIYVVNARNSPNTMQEIGRVRELTFREAGGGTGEPVDIDEEDTAENGYEQLIVWDPKDQEIVGGYRFIISKETHPQHLSTEHYFRFSDKFRQEYLPYTLELGRSFVQPRYQGTRINPKGLYSLDNLWDGLGTIVAQNPDIRYFFGKVTMYGHYNTEARNALMYFLHKYFSDPDHLVEPLFPIALNLDEEKFARLFTGGSYTEDYKILTRRLKELDEHIPPMINSYMNLSPSMRVFATVKNPDFGNVEETGILITFSDIYMKKVERHFSGFNRPFELV